MWKQFLSDSVQRVGGAKIFIMFIVISLLGVIFTIIEIYFSYISKIKFQKDMFIWIIFTVFLWIIFPLLGVGVISQKGNNLIFTTERIQGMWAIYLMGVLLGFAAIQGALWHYMQTP
jgi:uncharacterized membrane protein